jgi:hypothetical protein
MLVLGLNSVDISKKFKVCHSQVDVLDCLFL